MTIVRFFLQFRTLPYNCPQKTYVYHSKHLKSSKLITEDLSLPQQTLKIATEKINDLSLQL